MRTPAFWNSKNILSETLTPLSWLYGMGARLRQNAVVPVTLPIPVICVGNVTAGGSGKTPVALSLGKILKEQNRRAFFLSRGYGGRHKGPLLVDPEKHSAREVGDEPLLLARVLPTVVAKNRLEGAAFAVSQGAEIIIMDDGLQNPSIKKDVSLLVMDLTVGMGNGRLIPAGPLREPLEEALSRADAVIAIGGSDIATTKPVITARAVMDAAALKNQKAVAFCGLAYPQKFFAGLLAHGVIVVENIVFPDHYFYSENDIRTLARRAKEHDAVLVTTAKDAVKLSPETKALVNVVNMELQFDDPGALDALIGRATKKA